MPNSTIKGQYIDVEELVKSRTYDGRKQLIAIATLNNNVAALIDLLQEQAQNRKDQTQEMVAEIFSKIGRTQP